MRIISGALKGKSINFLKNSKTRPLKDSVRENIFNILEHSNLIKNKIENSNILDLYSGIGSFGLESLSRGAKKVTFIEQDINVSNILKDNLIKLSIINKSKIFTDKVENVLINVIKEKFHIFFFDPPFADLNFFQNIKLIKKKKNFKRNHIVIIHRDKKTKDDFENVLKIIKTKQYGRSKVIFGVFN
jgi:16S rRNA (guanine966-N2)-methyltransferase